VSNDDDCREGYGRFTEKEMERGDQLHDEARDRAYEKEMEEKRAMIPTRRMDQFTISMNGSPDADHLVALDLFARKLERELAEAREQRNECERQFQSKIDELIGVMNQRDQLSDELAACTVTMTKAEGVILEMIQQRDRLVEEIKIALGCLVTNYDIDGVSMSASDAADHLRKALAAVKGGIDE
jgi:seryl-tRNA synthetase